MHEIVFNGIFNFNGKFFNFKIYILEKNGCYKIYLKLFLFKGSRENQQFIKSIYYNDIL